MKLFVSFLLLAAFNLPAPVQALPAPPLATTPTPTPTVRSTNATTTPFGITPEQIIAAIPSTAFCASDAPPACRNATRIALHTNKSFSKFGFTSRGQQAAIFSLMAFESGNFTFDVNMFPGRPGQGTRNMMMFNFILPYAVQYNRTAVLAIRSDLTVRSTPLDVPDDAQKNAIRATVLSDDLSFASAAWYLRTRCKSEVALVLKFGTDDGFNSYTGPKCVGAGEDPARLALYRATLAAMSA